MAGKLAVRDAPVTNRPIARSNLTGGRNILAQLRETDGGFSVSEQKLAALVLAQTAQVTRMSLRGVCDRGRGQSADCDPLLPCAGL